MKSYLDAMDYVLTNGLRKHNQRTGKTTVSYTKGLNLKFELSKGYPLSTVRRVKWRIVVAELLFFLYGYTNNNELLKMGCNIWTPWAKKDGSLGKIYSHQWCNYNGDLHKYNGVDQITRVIQNLKEDPYDRRHLVTAWNPSDLEDQALPACHYGMNFTVDPSPPDSILKYTLNCHFTMRSSDLLVGLPVNIASYALLTELIAKQLNYNPGWVIYTCTGDAHVYEDQIHIVRELLKREPKDLPTLKFYDTPNLMDMTWKKDGAGIILEDFAVITKKTLQKDKEKSHRVKLLDYQAHPYIKAPVAV